MAFKIAARTILHLGGELISSDGVALYELIKNAFDAGSKEGVHIEITVRLKSWPGEWPARLAELSTKNGNILADLKGALLQDLDLTAPRASELADEIRAAKDGETLSAVVRKANEIVIRDAGDGMSKADLSEVYLTIGTRYRREERNALQHGNRKEGRAILGEKGIGRLSVMRLGQNVQIKTTRSGEGHWNLLEIDWSRFSHESDELLESIEIEPRTGESKSKRQEQGTRITVTRLNAVWTKNTLKTFAENDAAKLNNPFNPKDRYRIFLRFNGEIQPIPEFDKLILNNAHAQVSAEFTMERGEPQLRGRVNYLLKKRERTFLLEGTHLANIARVSLDVLRSLGAFSMETFWFNRQFLRSRVDGGVEISKIVNLWSGGLMLFRDGFRVAPYGDGNDDWLDLDERALASGGYKVNRKQLIGRVEIGSIRNPALTDQTNREGLTESPEKQALVNLLKHILEVQLRQFLNLVDKEDKARLQISFEVLGERVRKEKVSLRNNLRRLRQGRKESPEETLLFSEIDKTVDNLEEMMGDAQALADEFERGRSQYIHLAGLGLMVEFLAHELNRSTVHALGTLADGKQSGRGLTTAAIQTLELQLKTLQKRLSVLDPATTSGRQRREKFNIVELAQQVLDGHTAERQRHHISAPSVKVVPRGQTLTVFMVKGMVVQVLENLLNNALYWLKQEQRLHRDFAPHLLVEVDTEKHELLVADNGPGVREEIAEDIFKPFFTTKPPGEGKGLGLYISREIAHYHEVELRLSEAHRVHPKCFNTFVLTLPK